MRRYFYSAAGPAASVSIRNLFKEICRRYLTFCPECRLYYEGAFFNAGNRSKLKKSVGLSVHFRHWILLKRPECKLYYEGVFSNADSNAELKKADSNAELKKYVGLSNHF